MKNHTVVDIFPCNYRAMLRRARLCHKLSFVCPSVCRSVCDVQVPWSHRLEYFENNFTAD